MHTSLVHVCTGYFVRGMLVCCLLAFKLTVDPVFYPAGAWISLARFGWIQRPLLKGASIEAADCSQVAGGSPAIRSLTLPFIKPTKWPWQQGGQLDLIHHAATIEAGSQCAVVPAH